MDYNRVSLRLPANLYLRLVELAGQKGRSLNTEIVRAIIRHLASPPPDVADPPLKHGDDKVPYEQPRRGPKPGSRRKPQ